MGSREHWMRHCGLGKTQEKNGIETSGLCASELDSALHIVNPFNSTLIIANPLPRASHRLSSRHRYPVSTLSRPDLCMITALHIRPSTFWRLTTLGRVWPQSFCVLAF